MMKYARLSLYYFMWHYGRALADMRRVWENILWFLFNFFSIGLLARTLFKPWRRLGEPRTGVKGIEAFFSRMVIGAAMRILGFFLRAVIIVTGVIVLALAALWGFAFFILWILLPLILAFLFAFSWSALLGM